MKRLITSFIFTCFFVLSVALPTKALANATVLTPQVDQGAIEYIYDNLETILYNINGLLEQDGIEVDPNSLYIGSPFKLASEDEDVTVFPVYKNDKAIFTVSLYYEDGRYMKMVSPLYTDALNTVSGQILFFYLDGNFYYENESEIGPVAIYQYSEEEIERANFLDVAEVFEPTMPETIPYSVTQFTYEVDTTNELVDFNSIELEIQPFAGPDDFWSIGLGCPTVYATRPNTCWAAAAASTIRYYIKDDAYLFTSHGICNQIHGFRHESGCTGGSIYDVQKTFRELGPVGVADYYVKFNYMDVRNEIYLEHHVQAHGDRYDPLGNQYHAIVIYGYHYRVYKGDLISELYVCDSDIGRSVVDCNVNKDSFKFLGYDFQDMLYTWPI